MYIKTSTFVAAGILVLAGTPAAWHVFGSSEKIASPTSWAKALHGGGSAAGHGTTAAHGSGGSAGSGGSGGSLAGDQKPGDKPTPASLADLTGKWLVTVESDGGRVEARMTLKQNARKLTGTFSNPHGDNDFPLTGEYSEGAVTLTVEGKTDHGDMHFALKGAMNKEDGSLAGTMTSSMGESKFIAKRTK